jgi:cysteinyl-tRNA synthetase
LRGLPVDVAEAQDNALSERFFAAMDDDFNTPEALAALFDLTREINKVRETDEAKAAALAAQLRRLGGVLGLLGDNPDSFLKGAPASGGLSDQEVDDLIARRIEARKDKDWAEADRIRDLLQEHKILLEDGANGTIWRRG